MWDHATRREIVQTDQIFMTGARTPPPGASASPIRFAASSCGKEVNENGGSTSQGVAQSAKGAQQDRSGAARNAPGLVVIPKSGNSAPWRGSRPRRARRYLRCRGVVARQ